MTERELLFGIFLFIVGFIFVFAMVSFFDRHQLNATKKAAADDSAFKPKIDESTSEGEVDFSKRELRWFEILGVQENATFDIVQQAYRKQMSQYDSEVIAPLADELKQLADLRTKEIEDAFNFAIKRSRRAP